METHQSMVEAVESDSRKRPMSVKADRSIGKVSAVTEM